MLYLLRFDYKSL